MKEGDKEEADNFIPSCFRAFADIEGKTLKAGNQIKIESYFGPF